MAHTASSRLGTAELGEKVPRAKEGGLQGAVVTEPISEEVEGRQLGKQAGLEGRKRSLETKWPRDLGEGWEHQPRGWWEAPWWRRRMEVGQKRGHNQDSRTGCSDRRTERPEKGACLAFYLRRLLRPVLRGCPQWLGAREMRVPRRVPGGSTVPVHWGDTTAGALLPRGDCVSSRFVTRFVTVALGWGLRRPLSPRAEHLRYAPPIVASLLGKSQLLVETLKGSYRP